WAAVLLLCLGGPSLWRAVRAATRRELGAVVILGTASAGMMLFYSEATARIELGTATSIEFLGTLVVAVAALRRRRELVWIITGRSAWSASRSHGRVSWTLSGSVSRSPVLCV